MFGVTGKNASVQLPCSSLRYQLIAAKSLSDVYRGVYPKSFYMLLYPSYANIQIARFLIMIARH